MQDLKMELEELKELVRPLQEYLKEKHDPYTVIHVNQYGSEVFEGVMGFTSYSDGKRNIEYNHKEGE